jgi:tetratricopeptide (TPR) repeat protein
VLRNALRLGVLCAIAGCAASEGPVREEAAPARAEDARPNLAERHAAARALEREADHWAALARRDLAAPLYASAIETRAASDIPSTAARELAELALIQHERGRLPEAEHFYRRALAELDAPSRDDSELRALVSLQYGSLLRADGRARAALPLLDAALELRSTGPERAIALGEAGAALAELGRTAEATDRYERALAIWGNENTPESDALEAEALANLALLQRARGEHAKARALLERALPLYEKTLAPDDPTVLRVRELIAARTPPREPASEPDPAEVARALDREGTAYLDRHDYILARPLLERAVSIHESGVTAPVELGASLSYLGRTYAGLGDVENARYLLQRSLSLLEPALGKLDPLTLQTRASLENLRGSMPADRAD